MRCVRCRHDNRSGRRYCGRCGAAIPGACSDCGFVNEPHERFCGGCGIPTAGTRGREVGPGEAERRQLTVMFCDLVGSTALSERLEAEDLREVIQAFQRACAAEIARFGGYVARYMGDGLLAYFGYPQAHEDDAERGVRAGLAIIDAVGRLDTPPAVEAEVRVGIATGRVIAGDLIGAGASEEQAIVGDTPNLAARLQSMAEPGSLVVSHTTRRLVGPVFEVVDLGRHALKGFSEKQHAWQVVGPRRMGRRFSARMGAKLRPMIGRASELDSLLRCWERARSGQGRVVLVSGEAGMGKSRLVAELEATIAGDDPILETLQGAPHREDSVLHPLVEEILDASGIVAADANEVRVDKLASWIATEGGPPEAAGLFASLLGLDASGRFPEPSSDPEQRRRETLQACIDRVLARTEQAPTLLVVEDAQWLDPTTHAFLAAAAAQTRERRLLLVITHRPDHPPPLEENLIGTSLALQRLDPAGSAQLARGVDESQRLAHGAVERIVERADGVPLYLEELTQTMLEAAERGERGVEVPATLADSLMARLDRLPGAKEVAQIASVIGRDFSESLLADVWEGSASALEEGIDRLVSAGLFVTRAGGGYQFRQALVREVARESLLRNRRRAVHGRVAAALQRETGEGAHAAPEVLAYHLFEAGDRVAAADAWNRAAVAAEGRSSNQEARHHRERALEALEEQTLTPAVARRRAETALALAQVLRQSDELSAAEAAVDRAQQVIDAQELTDLQSEAFFIRGNLLFLRGAVPECLAMHTRALEVARRVGVTRAEASALGGLGDAEYARGRFYSSLQRFEECCELSRAHGFDDLLTRNLPMTAWCKVWLGQEEESIASGQQALTLAERSGYLRSKLLAHGALAYALGSLGRYDEGYDHATRAVRAGLKIDSTFFNLTMTYNGSRLLRLAGRLEERARILSEVELPARHIGLLGSPILAALASSTTDPMRCAELLALAEEKLGGRGIAHMRFWFYDEALVLAQQHGDWERVARYADDLEALTAAEPFPWAEERIARARQTVALTQPQA